MNQIPPDVNDVITRIDRRGDMSKLPNPSTPLDRYDEMLNGLFPDAQIRNDTEFDYGRSYRYAISMSQDREAAIARDDTLKRVLQKQGQLDEVQLACSVLAPFFLIKFVRYRLSNGEIDDEQSWVAFSEEQELIAERLRRAMKDVGMKPISKEMAEELVPDVETRLCERGEATVGDCLFFG